MASTYSSSLRLELITPGEQANTWGITTNVNLGTLIEQAISGYSTVNMASDADRTLTTANGNSDESRPAALKITSSGSLTATRNIIVPTVSKLYSVKNATTGGQSILVKTSGGTGITIPNGETAVVVCDGTNVVYMFTPAGMGVATTASGITNTPAGNIAATNVQAAINELDTEKAKVGALATSGITDAAASGANSDITSLTAVTTINRTGGTSIKGTNTNDNAADGFVGEYISSTVAPIFTGMTTAIRVNITSISLTAGDWDVTFNGGVNYASATVNGGVTISVTTTSTSYDTINRFGGYFPTTSLSHSVTGSVANVRFSLAGTTTVYATAQTFFSAGTAGCYGTLSARRVR